MELEQGQQQAEDLCVAAIDGDVNKVKCLLAQGANPNHPQFYALHSACRKGHLEIVKALVEAGADTERRDDDGRSPVHWAASYGHKEVLVYLIRDRKCSANTRDRDNNTPLHTACYHVHLDVVQYLVENAHCDTNVRNMDNQTVLHIACSRPIFCQSPLLLVQYLVEKANCDINATDNEGRTPLNVEESDYYMHEPTEEHFYNQDVLDYLKTQRKSSSRQPGSQFIISIQPKDVCCKPGDEVEFTISTAPSATTTYQWFFENPEISLPDYKGQTSECCLLIPKFLPKHKGAYWCVAEDASGTQVTSQPATLTAEGEKIERQDLQLIGKILEKSAIDFSNYGIETVHLLSGESDVTYEEMEFVMKLNPRTQVLSINLKQEITARVKEEQLYAKAINEKVSLTYTKILALGPGQVGKSTFVRRLLGIMEGNIQTSSPETQPRSSTGISESREACIQYTRVTGAITHEKKWCVLQNDLHDQLSGLMSLIVKQSQQGPQHETTQLSRQKTNKTKTVVKESLVECDQTLLHGNEGVGIKTSEPVNTKDPIATGGFPTLDSPLVIRSTQLPIATEQSASKLSESDIDKTIREFEKLKQECSHRLDTIEFEMLFNVADVGGQPAFLEMLPSLTIGPALYLVFMNLKQELNSRYPVPFKCKDSTTNLCKNYSYTSEEVLFSALSSIDCFGHSDEEVEQYVQKPASIDKKQKDSLALLVGTFLDKVNDEEIKLTNHQLKERLEETAFYKEGLILRNSFSLLVNNMSAEVSEIEGHRNKLEKILTAKFRKYQIPTQWLMLSICLKVLARNQKKYHVSFADCVKLGKYLDMDEEMVSVALQFLHKYIGLVMYFPRHENLKKIVVCDPQVVFSTISELIFNIYDHNQFQVSQAQYDHFVKTGCFSPQDIMLINDKDIFVNEEKKKLLPIDKLVDLLEYLNIAAKLPASTKDEVYFLPAVLQTAELDVVTRSQKGENNKLLPEPLCIHFKTGYVPLGFMCALIANLAVDNKFVLLFDESNKLYKNMIQFRFQAIFNVTVVSLPRYCEFRVTRQPSDNNVIEFWSKDGCSLIMETIRTVANKVIQSMQHGMRLIDNDSKIYEFAFHCQRHPDADFGQECLAKLDYDHSDQESGFGRIILNKATCTKCVTAIPLTPEMMVWFGKVPSTPLRICKQPARKGNVISIRADGVRPLTYQWLCDGDDQDYDGYATDTLIIKDSNLLSEGVFKCQVKDKCGNCVESDELDLFEDVLKRTWKLKKSEINKLKKNGFTSIRELKCFQLDTLDFNMGEKERMKPLLAFVQAKFDSSSASSDLSALRDIVDTPITGPLEYQMKYGDTYIQDPGTTSLHELMVKHDEQLDREIKDKDTALISIHFDDFENYIHRLELTGNEQADVKKIAQVSGNQVAVINCVTIWRGHESSKATFRALIRILLDLKKEKIAIKICQYLKENAGGDSQVSKQGELSPGRNEEPLTRKRNVTKSIVKRSSSEDHERSLSSATPVQRVGTITSSSAGQVIHSQVCNRRGPTANRITFQELMKQYNLTDEQLDNEIEEITYVAEYFDGVKIYSNAMGLTRAEQADVNELFHKRGTQVAMTECLTIWKQHNPYAATYRALLELLLGLRKEKIADEICQHLIQVTQ